MNKEMRRWGLGILGLIIGLGLGMMIKDQVDNDASDAASIREDSVNYSFINPLLEFEGASGRVNIEVRGIKTEAEKILNAAKRKGEVEYASLYFRDLNNGWWSGINIEEGFRPASLLKVPLMMAYYKLAEKDPGILDKQIKFERFNNDVMQENSLIPPQVPLVVGQSYSVQQLIDQSIIFSDNQAMVLLLNNINPADLRSTYLDLHLEDPLGSTSKGLVSVKEYSSFFRILYNSSYLNRAYSEKALEILSRVAYKDGLVAGVPSDIKIAHKFGEGLTENGGFQFHDAGIIYHKNKPYLLCVMTRGKDPKQLQNTIAAVSRVVYQTVDSQAR